MRTDEELNKGFILGDWEVLPAQGILRRVGEEIRPEPKVFAVLLALARRDGNLVTKDELIEEVWEGKAFSDEPILRCVSLLRGHFSDKKPFGYVETLQRRGYRLLKPVELQDAADSDVSALEGRGKRTWRAIAAVMAVALVAIAMWTWQPWQGAAAQSMAVLPIENLSGNSSNEYIVAGIKNSLAHRLAGIPDFTIKNARRRYEDEPSSIARDLGVENVLMGAMQLQGDTLKITWQLARGKDNVTIGSGQISGSLDDIFVLQERLATAVRNELAGELTPQLITRREPDSAAYNSYMRGVHLFEHRGDGDNLETAMDLFHESIDLDENYGPAYLALASAYALLPDYRQLPVKETHQLAIHTAEEGIAMDGSIADAASSVFGFVYHQQKRWQASEAAHQRAVNALVVDSNSFNWYSRMLASVGRREDALMWALAAEAIDPDNPVVNSRIALAYLWLNDTARAYEYFDRAGAMGAGGRTHLLGYALLLVEDGRFAEAEKLANAGAIAEDALTDWVEPVFRALADPSERDAAFQAMDRAWESRGIAPEVVLIVRTMLGDVDGAMEIARLLELPGEAFEMDLLFIPQMQALRSHPEFEPLLERLGIVDYWESEGCDWDGNSVGCEPG